MPKKTPLPQESPIYPERESKTLEFKSRLPDFRNLAKTCVAFANCAGGEIIIGIEDGTRKVLGIDPADRDRAYDAFPSSLYDLVSPSLIPHIYEKSIGNTSVLIIRIWPGDCMPYYIKSMGIPSGVFVRVGTASRPANRQTIDDLSRERRRITFDEEDSAHPVSILSRERLRDFYGKDTSTKRLFSDKLITHSPRFKDGFSVTNGGILMFCAI